MLTQPFGCGLAKMSGGQRDASSFGVTLINRLSHHQKTSVKVDVVVSATCVGKFLGMPLTTGEREPGSKDAW